MTTQHTPTPWVYIRSEPGLWTVGFYTPATAAWHTDSDHDTKEAAANRVAFLNGANAHAALVAALRDVLDESSHAVRDEILTAARAALAAAGVQS